MIPKKLLIISLGFVLVGIGFLLQRHTSGQKKSIQLNHVNVAAPIKVRGSIPYWDQERAIKSFKQHVHVFDSVSLFWYYLTDNGGIKLYDDAYEDESIIEHAHANGVKVSAVLTNLPEDEGTTWDSLRVEQILKDSTKQKQHIKELIAKLEKLNFDGVTIDFEEVDSEYKELFSEYIKNLSTELDKAGFDVGVALHPKHGFSTDNRYAFQDWKTLADYADELYIMAYGEHWDGGSAGPIASYPWVKQITVYAKSIDVSLSKFYLGIPLYGYDWKVSSDDEAVGLTYNQIQKLLSTYQLHPTFDERAKSSHFHYEANGIEHEVWYEDKQSVFYKLDLAKEANFGGVTFWRLGGEDQRIWATNSGIFKE